MNIPERIEEIEKVASACYEVGANSSEMVDLMETDTPTKMLMTAQSQMLIGQAVILRNLGLNLAREAGRS